MSYNNNKKRSYKNRQQSALEKNGEELDRVREKEGEEQSFDQKATEKEVWRRANWEGMQILPSFPKL